MDKASSGVKRWDWNGDKSEWSDVTYMSPTSDCATNMPAHMIELSEITSVADLASNLCKAYHNSHPMPTI